MSAHPTLAFSTWRRPRGTVFRLANSTPTVQVSAAVGRCECAFAHEHRWPVAGHTQLSPGCLWTDTQLGARRLDSVCSDPQPRSRRFHPVVLDHPTAKTHLFQEALQDPGHASGLLRRSCFSPLTCQCWPAGRDPSFVFLTFCGSSRPPATTRCRSTSFPLLPKPSCHARHKRGMSVPPQRDNTMRLHPATP